MPRTLPKLQGFPPTWETCNESTSCPSIKWGDSNGRSSNSTIPLKMFSLRVAKRSNAPALSFAQLGSRRIDQSPHGAPTEISTSQERNASPSGVPDHRIDRGPFVEAVLPSLAEFFGKE